MSEHYGVGTYRKRPVEVTALRWTGANLHDMESFIADPRKASIIFDSLIPKLYIYTKENVMYASIGDFIIRGVQGEYYPCKPDIFAETYEFIPPPPTEVMHHPV